MHPPSVFDPHSLYAWSIYHLSVLVMAVMIAIICLVSGLVFYCCIKFRSSRHPEPKLSWGNRKMEIIYTVGPLIIIIVLFGISWHTMNVSDPVRRHRDDVVIVGHQFWWEARYPGTGIVTANEIHIPVGKPILFGLESADVIHDWWVPQLGRKMDMTPGYHRDVFLEADKPGTYLGTCAEYCGREHAWMRIRVIAQTPEDFAAWEKQQEEVPGIPATGEAAKGREYFQVMSCSNCHAVEGTIAQGRVGPNLTHLASRETIAAGRLRNDPKDLYDWLKDPDAYKPGSYMPNLGLTDEQDHDLVAYLETLR
jgi:cytochrome c oxidase subunit 2